MNERSFSYQTFSQAHNKTAVLLSNDTAEITRGATTFSKPHIAGITGKAGNAAVAGAEAPNT